MKENKIYFYLPGLIDNFDLNCMLIERMRLCPDHFYPSIEIGAVFGAFPDHIWNGGRMMMGYTTSKDMDIVMNTYNNYGIPVRWTWTNPTLTIEDLKDKQCNRTTKRYENGMNEILVNNDLCENYFRERFPGYSFISSTTKRLNTMESLNQELAKDYKIVVVDYDFNNKWDLLEQIDQPKKCELLINPLCNPNCPYRKDHYRLIGERQKGNMFSRHDKSEECPAQHRLFHEIKKLPTFITVEDLYNKYVPAGFQHFKIEGRGMGPLKPLTWYLYYMVKPEYKDEEFGWLAKAVEKTCTEPTVSIYVEKPSES